MKIVINTCYGGFGLSREPEVIIKVIDRHVKSEFKRKNLPICITRDKYK